MTGKARILLYVNRPGPAGEYRLLAEGLARDARFEPVVYVDASPSEVPDALFPDLATVRAPDRIARSGVQHELFDGRLFRFLAARLRALTSRVPAIERILTRRALARFIARGRAAIAAQRPDAVVLSDDRMFRDGLGLAIAAREAGVPVILVPFAASDAHAEATRRLAIPALTTIPDWVRRDHPLHVFADPRGGVLFHDPDRMRALDAVGALGVTPWALGGGPVDAVCMADAGSAEDAIRLGVPPTRVHVTGAPSHDALARLFGRRAEDRRALAAEHGLDPDGILVLVALPAYAEIGIMPSDASRAAQHALLSAIRDAGLTPLVSLHPRQSREAYGWIARERLGTLLARPFRDAVAAVDIAVIYVSSIAEWTALTGTPTILVNQAGLSEIQLARFSALRRATLETLASELRAFTTGPALRAAFRDEARASATALGAPDGEAIARIAAVIASLTDPRLASGGKTR